MSSEMRSFSNAQKRALLQDDNALAYHGKAGIEIPIRPGFRFTRRAGSFVGGVEGFQHDFDVDTPPVT